MEKELWGAISEPVASAKAAAVTIVEILKDKLKHLKTTLTFGPKTGLRPFVKMPPDLMSPFKGKSHQSGSE